MVQRGILMRFEAQHGKEAETEAFLLSALPLVRQEAATTAWFAVRFGRSEYGIFAVFPDEAGREAHLTGPVAQALREQAETLFTEPPQIRKLAVLASKLPRLPSVETITRGLLLTFEAKSGHEAQVEAFLREAQALVQEEPETITWFALHFEGGEYGIFDVFPDNGGRFAHLTGHVPRELAKHALSLLGSVPEMHLLHVLADQLPG